MLKTFATIATTTLLIGCSAGIGPQDARRLYIPVCLSDQEKTALKATRALSRATIEKIIRNNAKFGVEC